MAAFNEELADILGHEEATGIAGQQLQVIIRT